MKQYQNKTKEVLKSLHLDPLAPASTPAMPNAFFREYANTAAISATAAAAASGPPPLDAHRIHWLTGSGEKGSLCVIAAALLLARSDPVTIFML
jgi:hypothetical protein